MVALISLLLWNEITNVIKYQFVCVEQNTEIFRGNKKGKGGFQTSQIQCPLSKLTAKLTF